MGKIVAQYPQLGVIVVETEDGVQQVFRLCSKETTKAIEAHIDFINQYEQDIANHDDINI